MTFSTSSSSSRVLLAAVLLWSGTAAAQPVSGQAAAAEPVGEARRGLRVLVLPPENLAASSVPSKEVLASIERMAAMAGAEVIGGGQLEDYLARYRIRYTGGVDPVASVAARGDLGAEAILVTSVVLWGASPPRIGVTLRLVSAAEVPVVLWMDGYAGTGDDSIGLFSLGAITDFGVLQAKALNVLGKSLESHLSGERAGSPQCPGGGWFLPRLTYRARPDARELASVVVLPFVNQYEAPGRRRDPRARGVAAVRRDTRLPARRAGIGPGRAPPAARRDGGRGLHRRGPRPLRHPRCGPGRRRVRVRLRGRSRSPEARTSR